MKKKSVTRVFLLSLLILALAFLALAISPYMRAGTDAQVAAAESAPTVSTGNVEVLRGKYFTVDIILSDNTLGLTGLEIGLDYDPTVMTLVKYDTTKANGFVQRGSALSSLGLTTSNFSSSAGMNVHPLQFIWNGTDPDYTNGTLLTLRFKSISSSDENLLGKHYFTLTYKQSNTFRTTPKAEGGNIIYLTPDMQPGYVDVTAGKFQCTYFDWDGSEIVHYEENDFSLFTPVEPPHPTRASTRTHYFTYEEDQWDAENPWTEDMEEPDSINWDITALYTAHAQPYTVYYYFGEKDSETGVITMGETADDYYYTWDTTGETPVKEYCVPKTSVFGGTIILPAQYTEAYYSLSPWYTDSACTEQLLVGLIPEDTSVDAAMVAASTRGVPLEDTFSLKLYAYRQQNEDVVPPEELDVTASKLENVVTVDGTTVTVDITLTKNFGIMSMLLTLDYDRTCLTLTNVARGEAFPSDVFSTTNNEYLPEGYAADPFRLYWSNSTGNYYGTGVIATLTFTLDPNASVGDHLITLTYTPKQDVTRYYDQTEISGTPVPAMLWYTTLNVVDGYVTLREVTAPTEHEGTYTFNKAEQTYTFATNGDLTEYDIVTSNKRTSHGSQTVTVALKGNDNVYRFWKATEGRPRTDISFTFEILKRSVAIPMASTVDYVYNHAEQTYAFANVGGAGYYTASDDFKRTIVGSQTITCSLDYPEESYWGTDEEDVTDKKYTFEILRLRVTPPVSAGNTYTYDTTEQTYAFSVFDTTQTYYTMPAGADKRTVSGSQTITVTLKDTNNYCWDEENDPTAAKVFNFEIAKRSITSPTETTTTYVYSGSEKTYLFASEPQENKELYYSVSDNKRTEAGSQNVTVALLHKGDTYWGENEADTNDKKYLFTVEKMTVIPPTASAQEYVFDVDASTGEASSKTYQFAAETGDNTLYTVDTAAMTKSVSGTTYIGVSLNDTANYKWSTTGLSDALSYEFYVAKKAVSKPTPNVAFTNYFVYKGSPISYVWDSIADKKFYTITNDSRTDAGTYTGEDAVTVTLKYPAHSYWAGTDPVSSDPIQYDFVIAKQQVVKPTAHSGNYFYSGEEVTYTFASVGGEEHYTVSGNKRTNAGSQTVTVTLGDNKSNYAWKPVGEEAVSSDDLEYTFEILPQRVSVPQNKIEQGSPKTYTFTGSPIQAEYNSALQTDLYDVDGDVQTSSGTHTITFTLKLNTDEQKNYCWSDGTYAPKQIDFTIRKRVVAAPSGTEQVVTYNGGAQSYVFTYEDTAAKGVYYSCSETSFANAGAYTVTCSLIYPEDTYWSTEVDDVENKTFSFTITKKNVALIEIADKPYNGSKQTSGIAATSEYSIVSDEGGVTAGSYSLVVKLTNDNYRWADGNETLQRTFTYAINSVTNSWVVAPSISGWTYGEEGNTGSATATFGNVVITYRSTGASEYSGTLPTTAGPYVARFYVAATESYTQLSVEKSFEIQKAALDMSSVAWNYEDPFTYDRAAHTIGVVGLPALFAEDPTHFYPTYMNNSKTDRGDYSASVAFTYDSVNYRLDYGENEFSSSCDYTILPCEVTVVWGKEASYVFTGSTFAKPTAKYVDLTQEDVSLFVSEKDGKAFRAAGSYTFNAAIADPNYVAAAGTDSTSVTVDKKPISAPTAHVGTYVYSASEQTYTFASSFDADWMTASNNKRTAAGNQYVTVDLTDKANTYWADTEYSVEALTSYLFTILKAEVVKPTETTQTYVYTEELVDTTLVPVEQTYAFASVGEVEKYSVSNNKRTNAGSQDVTVSLNDKDNYRWKDGDSEDLTFTFTIAKKNITVISVEAKAYDGTLQTSGVINTYYYEITEDEGGVEAGTYPFKAALTSTNYRWSDGDETIERTFTFTIASVTNSWSVVPAISGWTYGEEGVAGSATATFGEVVITYRADGSSAYSGTLPTTAGSYYARFYVAGTDSYSGLDVEKAFTIRKATLDMSEVAWNYTALFTYDGDTHTVSVIGLPAEFTSAPSVFYLTYTDNAKVNKGEYTAYVTITYDTVNYEAVYGENTFVPNCAFIINPREVTVLWTKAASYVFTGTTFMKPTAKYVDLAEEDVVLTVTEKDGKEFRVAGSYTFNAAIADPNYVAKTGSDTIDVTVDKKAISAPTAHVGTYVYSGNEQTYTFASSFDADWMTASNNKRTAAGSQYVTVDLTDKANTYWADTEYSVEALTSYLFTIEKAEVIQPTETVLSYVFTTEVVEEELVPVEQTYVFATEGETAKYSVTNDKRANAGSQTVTVSLNDADNYRWKDGDSKALTFTFTIAKKKVALIEIEDKPYNGSTQTSGVAATAVCSIVSDEGGVTAGTYHLVVKLKDANYCWADENETLQRTFDYKITSVTNSWIAAPAISGWTYGEEGDAGSATATFGEVVITYRADGSSAYSGTLPTTAGSYYARFYVAGTDSYSGLDVEKAFTIRKATLDMSEVAWNYTAPFTYDGDTHTVSVVGLPAEFTSAPSVFYLTYTDNAKVNKGDYIAYVTITYDTVNYEAVYGENTFVPNCAFIINPCEVTVVWTKASSYTFTGTAFTKPTAKYVDLAEEDVVLTVTEKDGKEFRAAGNYTFVATIADANYVAKTGSDTIAVTVDKKAISAPTAHVGTYIYSGNEQTYTFASSFDADWMTASNNTRKVVGSQYVTVDLIDKANTYWADTEYSVEALTNYLFTILKAEVIQPTETVLSYTFNGESQAYTFASTGDDTLYKVDNDTRTAHGSQTVKVSLYDADNYRWKEGDSEDLAFTFTILKLAVAAPTADETSYVYDGTSKTYTFATAGDSEWFTPSGTVRRDAGSQTVTVALTNKDDTYWKDTDEEVEDLTFTFSIAQATVKKPTADATAYVYDGTEKTYELGNTEDGELYSLTGAVKKSASGSNTITATLLDADNYRWEEGDSEPLTFTFSIAKLAVTAPTAAETTYVYDGTRKTYPFLTEGDKDRFTVFGAARTDAGSQTVTVTLANKIDTYWAGTKESVEDLTFTFTILKAEAAAPTASELTYVYTGAEQTYTFATEGDAALYTVSANTMTNAGSMTVTVSLVSPTNYDWKGTESNEPLAFTFTIAPAKVTIPAEDDTVFYCNGKTQTYTVAPSTYYTVSGANKSEYGTTDVVIALNDKNNYVWDNAPAADHSEDIHYSFTILHDYKNQYVQDTYKESDADCTHSAMYHYVCDCGEVGEDTYPYGDPLGHLYVVLFDWGEPEVVDGVDSYSEVYVNVRCGRCDHEDRILADLTVDVVLPGKAKGSKTYTATVELDHKYTDTRVVELPALYHNYGDPTWTWTENGDDTPIVVATFPCIDEGFEHLSVDVPAEVTIRDAGNDYFEYVATAYFYEKAYEDVRSFAKPTLTFFYGEEGLDMVSYRVVPGQDVTALIPEVPTKENAVFLKWWEADHSISLLYTETGYTRFVMRNADRTFVALWKSLGQITVAVSDVEGAAFAGCVVVLKQGEETLDTITTDESGRVSFNDLEYGNYSIVVTYTDGTTVTYTTGTVLGESEKVVPVKMSEKRFNTEVKDEDGKNVSVENLENTVSDEDKEQIVTAGQEGDVAEITVVLSVITETNEQVVEEMTEWIESNNNEVLDLSDITLVKTVKIVDGSGAEVMQTPTNIESSDVLVDITFPLTDEIYSALAKVHGSVDNVLVARKEGTDVGFMTKYTEEVALASEEECFYVKEEDGVPYIVVRTKTFSTAYGLCVNAVSVGADNVIESFVVTDWTYGETPVPVTATARYGTPVIYYQVNGEWVTTLPTGAGTYNVRAVVEETEEYKSAEAGGQLVIAKARFATDDIRFEDLTVVYDGEVHSILVTGVPDGVEVTYEGNGQVDVGEYVVTATFNVGPNYEPIPAMTATLTITEEETGCCKCFIFWILLIIAIVELILFILFFLRGNKYKKKLNEAKEGESMSAIALTGLTPTACLIINIVLLVVDVLLLGAWVWALIRSNKYKKKYEELTEAAPEAKEEATPASEDADKEGADEK